MSAAGWLISGFVASVVVANGITTERVWRSPLYERAQKIAQTALLWFLPGSVVFVAYLLRDPLQAERGSEGDATLSADYGTPDNIQHSSDHGGPHF
jgi:hypothetical protein